MKVILCEEVKGKGVEGDVVEVAHGFAVNYLLPRGIAVQATPGNLKQLEARKHNIAKRELARTTDANTLREALEGKTVVIAAKAGEEGQLFGSVTNVNVAEAIAEQLGVTIDRKKIDVAPIKACGEYAAQINLYHDIKAAVVVSVADEKAIAAAAKAAAEAAAAAEEAAEEVAEEATEEVAAE